jgi:hypothetical protein
LSQDPLEQPWLIGRSFDCNGTCYSSAYSQASLSRINNSAQTSSRFSIKTRPRTLVVSINTGEGKAIGSETVGTVDGVDVIQASVFIGILHQWLDAMGFGKPLNVRNRGRGRHNDVDHL